MPANSAPIPAIPVPYGSANELQVESEESIFLVLIADGYDDKAAFLSDCNELANKLTLIAPFGDAAVKSIVSIYACFEPRLAGYSFPIGPNQPSSLSTSLGAYYQSSTSLVPGTLRIDYDKLLDVGNRFLVWSENANKNFSLFTEPNSTNSHTAQSIPGAIVILLPKVQVGAGSTASYIGLGAEETLLVEMEHVSTQAQPVYFAATTCNEGFERVAARALAIKLGLGDESEQDRGLPSDALGSFLGTKPNLVYVPDPTQAGSAAAISKWRTITSEPIVVHQKPDSPTNAALDEQSSPLKAQPVGMWEGGGGYSNGIYRPAHECLMRRKPGVGALVFKLSQHPFCPVCRVYLHKTITGEYSTKRVADAVSLSTQRSEYDKVLWKETQVYNAATDTTDFFRIGPGDAAYNYPGSDYTGPKKLAFWGYSCHVSSNLNSAAPLSGFYFDAVKVHQSQYYGGVAGNRTKQTSEPRDVRDVFSSIGFRNLKVTFENGAPGTPPDYEFVIADHIRENNYTLEKSWRGHIGADHLYQTGWKLRLVKELPNCPRLEVELSLVMRGPAPDFDPGGVPVALKCYPQIQFKWIRKQGVTTGVQKFEGTVRTIVNVKHYCFEPSYCVDPTNGSRFVAGHHGTHGEFIRVDASGNDTSKFNDVSCFADSNLSANYYGTPSAMKRSDMEFPAPITKPTWAAIFDYYLPHIAQSAPDFAKQFVGAYKHDPTTRQGKVRKMYVKHLVSVDDNDNLLYNNIFISKFPRQGGYDNMHVNGYMGKHKGFAGLPDCDAQAVSSQDVVAAPFCGQDCFHMHWRWSLLSDTIANLSNTIGDRLPLDNPNPFQPWLSAPSFRGWNATQSHTRLGSPLIPPNQELTIRLEAVDHTKSHEDKVVDYIVSVTSPAPSENQVILEQGMGWAMIYSEGPGTAGAVNAILETPPIPNSLRSPILNTLFPPSLYKDREQQFRKIYDYIRFHHEFDGLFSFPSLPGAASTMKIFNHAQVPDGRDVPTPLWPNPLVDYFLSSYKESGDFFNPSLYPDNQQIVVEANVLTGISLEDL